MQAEIKFIPGEGAKSINKAVVKSYDSQGIVMSEDEIFKAQSEQEKDKLQVTLDVPVNGSIEITTKSGYVADPEAYAAVPPPEAESDEVKEGLKKKADEKKRLRDEGRREAALERGLMYEPPMKFPAEAQHAHAEKKDDKLDMTKNPSPAITPQPKETPTQRK